MIAQRDIFHCVSVACRVLRSEVPKLPPISAPMKLTVSGGEVSEGVERGVVRVADYRLARGGLGQSRHGEAGSKNSDGFAYLT